MGCRRNLFSAASVRTTLLSPTGSNSAFAASADMSCTTPTSALPLLVTDSSKAGPERLAEPDRTRACWPRMSAMSFACTYVLGSSAYATRSCPFTRPNSASNFPSTLASFPRYKTMRLARVRRTTSFSARSSASKNGAVICISLHRPAQSPSISGARQFVMNWLRAGDPASHSAWPRRLAKRERSAPSLMLATTSFIQTRHARNAGR